MLLPANWLFGADGSARVCAAAANVTSSSNNNMRIDSPKHYQLPRGTLPRFTTLQMIAEAKPDSTRCAPRIYVSSEVISVASHRPG